MVQKMLKMIQKAQNSAKKNKNKNKILISFNNVVTFSKFEV
jgi:hypothetical protein